MFDRFKLNVSFNGLQSRIETLPIGLADREGEFDLYYDPRQMGGASMAATEGKIHVKVPCRPLADVLREKEVARVSVLKIDVEGFEANVLIPFFAMAPRSLFPEIILIESPDGIDWTALGYRFQKRTHAHNSIFIRA
jgi:FkbM family methyltransferase